MSETVGSRRLDLSIKRFVSPVLVVSIGNSGARIALELTPFRRVRLAGRDTGRLRRWLLARDVCDWATFRSPRGERYLLWNFVTVAITPNRDQRGPV